MEGNQGDAPVIEVEAKIGDDFRPEPIEADFIDNDGSETNENHKPITKVINKNNQKTDTFKANIQDDEESEEADEEESENKENTNKKKSDNTKKQEKEDLKFSEKEEKQQTEKFQRDERAVKLNIDPDIEQTVSKIYKTFGFDKSGDDYVQTLQEIKSGDDLIAYFKALVDYNAEAAKQSSFANEEIYTINQLVKFENVPLGQAIDYVLGNQFVIDNLTDIEAITMKLESEDYSPEEIESELKLYEKEEGVLRSKGDKARAVLSKMEAQRVEHELNENKRTQEQKRTEIRNKVLSIEGFGESGSIKINSEISGKMADYLLKPIGQNGESQFFMDINNNEDAVFAISFLAQFGYDIERMVETLSRMKDSPIQKGIFQKLNAERQQGTDHSQDEEHKENALPAWMTYKQAK